MVIELSTAQLAQAADGSETGPSPAITILPDENLQVKCEGDFEAVGVACVFSAWTYTRQVTPSGSKVIRANHTVTVRPVVSPGPDEGPTLWSVRVSGNDVDGAPQIITYHYLAETPAGSSPSAVDSEKTVDQAAYDGTKDSPYVGTAVVITPLGHSLTVPVRAHIIGSALVLYDPSHLLAPNGIIPLRIVDATTPPVPVESFIRWVYVDQSPAYNLQLDARVALTSFRQTSDANGPITARARVLLNNSIVPYVGDWGEAHVAIDLHAADFPTCTSGADSAVQCAGGDLCNFGFCVEPPPPEITYDGATMYNGPEGVLRHEILKKWYMYMPHVSSAVPAVSWPSAVWCVQPDGLVGPWGLLSDVSIPTFVNGDIACPLPAGSSKLWAGPFPFSHRQTLETVGSLDSKLSNAQLFSACLKELDRTIQKPTKLTATSYDDYKDGLLDYKADCINIGAVSMAISPMMYGSQAYPASPETDWERRRLGMRMLQEWARLHGFLMHQGVEQYKQEDVILRQTTSSGEVLQQAPATSASSPDPATLMVIMEKGVVGLLGPWTLGGVLQYDDTGTSPLWKSDYRAGVPIMRRSDYSGNDTGKYCPDNMDWETALDADASPYDDCLASDKDNENKCKTGTRFRHCVIKKDASLLPNSDDIPNGFVPVLTDALTGYLRVAEADLNRALMDGYAAGSGAASGAGAATARVALARYGTAIRLAIQMEAFSSAMAREEKTCTQGADAGTTCTNPRWYERWLEAASELHLQMNRCQSAAFKLAAGANPLGVPDNDTPIFFGDVTGTNSRYFASSDYLINTWADPAVKTAQSALATARDAWIAARNATITTEENKAAHDRRMDDIASSAGRDMLDNCGGVIVAGKALAARDVVPTVSSLGIDGARGYLDECFVHGGGTCTLAPSDNVVKESRRSQFDEAGAVARAELCRLDYMRANYKSLWDGNVDKVNGLRGDLAKFMTTGTGTTYFCYDCGTDPTLPPLPCSPLNCAGNCYYDYGAEPTGSNSGWKSDTTCQYKAENCEAIAQATFAWEHRNGGYWSDEWPCWDSTFSQPGTPGTPQHAARDQKLLKCADDSWVEDGHICDPLFGLGCAYYTGDSADEAQQLAADYLRDCLGRHVHTEVGEQPKQPAGGRSSTWQDVTVGKDDATGRRWVQLGGDSLDVDKFYLEALKSLRDAEGGVPWSEARAACAADGYVLSLPDFTVPKECLHGKLGHGYQALIDIWAQADALSAELIAATKDWLDTLLACKVKAGLGGGALTELKVYLNQRAGLLATAGDVAVMKATVDGVLGGAARGGGDPGATLVNMALGGLSNYLFADAAEKIRKRITALDNEHTKFIAQLNFAEGQINCALEVKKAHNKIRPIEEQIATKFDQCQTAQIGFDSMKFENWDKYATALAQLNTEEHRTVGDLAHHYWYDEKVERFGKAMSWAKQTSYLALRAVEFEFQATLDLRSKVVTARHPDQLEAAVLELKQIQASRSVNRRRPEESSIVLSLRDDVLGIEDHSKAPSGERNWTPAQRFKGRLWDEGYRVRDQSGKWLGQGVQFSLTEGGVLLNRCGERLWRVTATVQGDGLSPLAPGTPLLLLKRNTFYSQFCTGHGEGQVHQVNSVTPSSQLFTGGSTGVPDGAEAFSTAAIFPWFNVRRFDFYNVSYRNGASEELAGRGLYGDYILLFPKEILDEQASPPFPLEKVEDVLLRLDYLSVDNLAAVSGSGPATTTEAGH